MLYLFYLNARLFTQLLYLFYSNTWLLLKAIISILREYMIVYSYILFELPKYLLNGLNTLLDYSLLTLLLFTDTSTKTITLPKLLLCH